MSNTFGTLLRLTTFGESHGEAIGGILDGFPSNVVIDFDAVQAALDRRRPSNDASSTSRREPDKVRFLSGIFQGKTTGSPIAFMVENKDCRSADYSDLEHLCRPSHADFVYREKYHHRDHRGGGRQSARITLARVVAGALAQQVLTERGIGIHAYVSQIGETPLADGNLSPVLPLLEQLRQAGDTVGGCISCRISGCPIGLGEPEFGKLHALLGSAMLSINAARAFEVGSGFEGCTRRGSQENDAYDVIDGRPVTKTNHSGGIQGGISNGNDILFRVGFKPIASIAMPQDMLTADNRIESHAVKGRHDVCAVPRAVPIVEAMAALVLMDCLLMAHKL